MCSPASATARGWSSSIRGARPRRSGRTSGSARHRLRHRARERRRARDHRRRPRERRLRRAGHRALRGVPRVRRALHAGARRGDLGRPRRGDPRTGARLWERRARATLLDARHHRASQRDRPRAGADQPRIADRPRRPLRLRPQPVARPEQRAGRRRHGRRAEQAARLPERRGRRGARPLRCRVGNHAAAAQRLAPHADVRGDGARGAARALRDRREPRAVRGRRAARPAAA